MTAQVHVLWDNTTLVSAAKSIATEWDCTFAQHAFCLDYKHLYTLVGAGREVITTVTNPPQLRAHLELFGAPTQHPLTVQENLKQGEPMWMDYTLVPQPITIKNFSASLRHVELSDSDLQVAIVTGDGAILDSSELRTLVEALTKARRRVSVICWASACAPDIVSWMSDNGILVPLEKYYFSVTYIQGGRHSLPLS